MSLCWSIFIVIDSYWILFGVRMEKEHQYVDYDMNIIEKQHRFTKLFSSVYRPSLYKLLELQSKYVIDVCKEFNIECWLDGGTLLGSYREKHIFAWDEDGDFNVHKKDIEKFKSESLNKVSLISEDIVSGLLKDIFGEDVNKSSIKATVSEMIKKQRTTKL